MHVAGTGFPQPLSVPDRTGMGDHDRAEGCPRPVGAAQRAGGRNEAAGHDGVAAARRVADGARTVEAALPSGRAPQ